MSLLPSVLCDCVGLDRYTTAFGILFLFRGFTSIIGPPAAGLYLEKNFMIIVNLFYLNRFSERLY